MAWAGARRLARRAEPEYTMTEKTIEEQGRWYDELAERATDLRRGL